MRITSEMMVSRSLERLHTRLTSYERVQSQLATGKRILAASDDPAGARRAASLRSQMAAREQDLRNASDARGWLDTADSQLQTAMERLTRARELTVRGATSASQSERDAIAIELRSIADELVGIANTNHLGRPLFGGFTAGPAVELVGGAWTTRGDGDEVSRRVSDSELVRVNVTASEWLGFGSPQGDLLTQLHTLAGNLEAGDQAAVGAALDGLSRAADSIAGALGTVGAASNRIESAASRASELLLTLRTERSEIEDVNIAEAIMEQQIQQVAYEATLQALAKALPPSLVAFLR